MPFQHPEESGYGYVIERYAARKDRATRATSS